MASGGALRDKIGIEPRGSGIGFRDKIGLGLGLGMYTTIEMHLVFSVRLLFT